MTQKILTPQNRPVHETIGRFFYSGLVRERVCYCDSYDPDLGFWMTCVLDPKYRFNVSERAIRRTIHPMDDSPKPQSAADVIGRVYHVVDITLPPEQWVAVETDDAATLGMSDTKVLFFFKSDAIKFIERVRVIAARLKQAPAAVV